MSACEFFNGKPHIWILWPDTEDEYRCYGCGEERPDGPAKRAARAMFRRGEGGKFTSDGKVKVKDGEV